MFKKLIIFAVIIAAIVGGILYLPKYKENKSFHSAAITERQGISQRQKAISLYKRYLQDWPEGRYSRNAKSRIMDLQEDQIREDFAHGLNKALKTKDYDKVITSISLRITENPRDQMSRLMRAFLLWGFNHFDKNTWTKSIEDINVVLEQNGVAYEDMSNPDQKPIVKLAIAILDQANSFKPIDPPATSPEFINVSSIKANNIVQFYVGAAAIFPGQTASFDNNGHLKSLQDGREIYTLKQQKNTPFLENEKGIQFIYVSNEQGKQRLVPISEII
jgi:hypothetical protein